LTTPRRPPGRWSPRDLAGPIAAGLPVALIATYGGAPIGVAVPLLGVAIVAAELLRRSRLEGIREAWFLPVLGAFAAVALLAPRTLLSELWAALAALGLLYWISFGLPGAPSPAHRLSGLALPGLAAGLALTITLFLPEGPALVGVASALLAGVLLALAALFSVSARSPVGLPQE